MQGLNSSRVESSLHDVEFLLSRDFHLFTLGGAPLLPRAKTAPFPLTIQTFFMIDPQMKSTLNGTEILPNLHVQRFGEKVIVGDR